jgi:hypothetical protein
MEASKQQLLQRRRTAVGTAGVIWPPQKVLTKLANVDQLVHKTPFKYKYTMWFGKNKGELLGRANGTGYFEWKPTISKRRYDLLLKLKHPDPHPNIVTIDEGEWKYSVDDDDLQLECVLRISNPIENRTTSIEGGLIDLHRMSIDDIINSEGKMLIPDTYHMCRNVRNWWIYWVFAKLIIKFVSDFIGARLSISSRLGDGRLFGRGHCIYCYRL